MIFINSDNHWVDDLSKRLFPLIFLAFNIFFWIYILDDDNDENVVPDADQYINVGTV